MSAERRCEVALVGLGAMGANLARNFARHGRRVLGFDRDVEAARRLAAAHPEAGLTIAASWSELLARLERPRRIVLLVPAGAPVDDVLDALDPHLEPGDVLVDAGNSHYVDTERRIERARPRPWHFVGMGVSGGAEGALEGPSLMPGGDGEAWEVLRPALEEVAARGPFGPCVAYCGRRSAGHFVKMVHNGIEYGDMQLLAETAACLRDGLGLRGGEVADTFAAWNRGELESFLVGLTAEVFRTPDPDREGALLVDSVLDRAGQKGTGGWTVRAALELGVAVPTIAAAVDARVQSSQKELRVEAARRAGRTERTDVRSLEGIGVEDLEHALLAARVSAYTQGFVLLATADRAHDYGVDPAAVARIWTAGCILRARLLERIVEVLPREPEPELLPLALGETVTARLPAWRRVVAAASRAGIPVPCLGASLAWFDTLTTARGSAALIQAQRDAFGRHGFERIDHPGEVRHADWSSSG